MTQPNDSKTKDLGEIQGDIEETRQEIGKDLSAIGEKFSAENIKHETRELVDEAKEAVVEKLRDPSAKPTITTAARNRRTRAIGHRHCAKPDPAQKPPARGHMAASLFAK